MRVLHLEPKHIVLLATYKSFVSASTAPPTSITAAPGAPPILFSSKCRRLRPRLFTSNAALRHVENSLLIGNMLFPRRLRQRNVVLDTRTPDRPRTKDDEMILGDAWVSQSMGRTLVICRCVYGGCSGSIVFKSTKKCAV